MCVVMVEGQTYRQNDATVSMKKTTWQEWLRGGEDDVKHVCVQNEGMSRVMTSLLSATVQLVG